MEGHRGCLADSAEFGAGWCWFFYLPRRSRHFLSSIVKMQLPPHKETAPAAPDFTCVCHGIAPCRHLMFTVVFCIRSVIAEENAKMRRGDVSPLL